MFQSLIKSIKEDNEEILYKTLPSLKENILIFALQEEPLELLALFKELQEYLMKKEPTFERGITHSIRNMILNILKSTSLSTNFPLDFKQLFDLLLYLTPIENESNSIICIQMLTTFYLPTKKEQKEPKEPSQQKDLREEIEKRQKQKLQNEGIKQESKKYFGEENCIKKLLEMTKTFYENLTLCNQGSFEGKILRSKYSYKIFVQLFELIHTIFLQNPKICNSYQNYFLEKASIISKSQIKPTLLLSDQQGSRTFLDLRCSSLLFIFRVLEIYPMVDYTNVVSFIINSGFKLLSELPDEMLTVRIQIMMLFERIYLSKYQKAFLNPYILNNLFNCQLIFGKTRQSQKNIFPIAINIISLISIGLVKYFKNEYIFNFFIFINRFVFQTLFKIRKPNKLNFIIKRYEIIQTILNNDNGNNNLKNEQNKGQSNTNSKQNTNNGGSSNKESNQTKSNNNDGMFLNFDLLPDIDLKKPNKQTISTTNNDMGINMDLEMKMLLDFDFNTTPIIEDQNNSSIFANTNKEKQDQENNNQGNENENGKEETEEKDKKKMKKKKKEKKRKRKILKKIDKATLEKLKTYKSLIKEIIECITFLTMLLRNPNQNPPGKRTFLTNKQRLIFSSLLKNTFKCLININKLQNNNDDKNKNGGDHNETDQKNKKFEMEIENNTNDNQSKSKSKEIYNDNNDNTTTTTTNNNNSTKNSNEIYITNKKNQTLTMEKILNGTKVGSTFLSNLSELFLAISSRSLQPILRTTIDFLFKYFIKDYRTIEFLRFFFLPKNFSVYVPDVFLTFLIEKITNLNEKKIGPMIFILFEFIFESLSSIKKISKNFLLHQNPDPVIKKYLSRIITYTINCIKSDENPLKYIQFLTFIFEKTKNFESIVVMEITGFLPNFFDIFQRIAILGSMGASHSHQDEIQNIAIAELCVELPVSALTILPYYKMYVDQLIIALEYGKKHLVKKVLKILNYLFDLKYHLEPTPPHELRLNKALLRHINNKKSKKIGLLAAKVFSKLGIQSKAMLVNWQIHSNYKNLYFANNFFKLHLNFENNKGNVKNNNQFKIGIDKSINLSIKLLNKLINKVNDDHDHDSANTEYGFKIKKLTFNFLFIVLINVLKLKNSINNSNQQNNNGGNENENGNYNFFTNNKIIIKKYQSISKKYLNNFVKKILKVILLSTLDDEIKRELENGNLIIKNPSLFFFHVFFSIFTKENSFIETRIDPLIFLKVLTEIVGENNTQRSEFALKYLSKFFEKYLLTLNVNNNNHNNNYSNINNINNENQNNDLKILDSYLYYVISFCYDSKCFNKKIGSKIILLFCKKFPQEYLFRHYYKISSALIFSLHNIVYNFFKPSSKIGIKDIFKIN
ncbi:anillin [Anaeramoeba flamelloides]|uniref:Anillin n=1 Tax=Anaeramoeba flamelloides TaxID=1746091 RepID=A0AAV7Z397_9EUKA|nr:anillin [Anaeramoeba flamelloides]